MCLLSASKYQPTWLMSWANGYWVELMTVSWLRSSTPAWRGVPPQWLPVADEHEFRLEHVGGAPARGQFSEEVVSHDLLRCVGDAQVQWQRDVNRSPEV